VAMFTNFVGNLAAPYFIEAVVRGTMTQPVAGTVNAVSVFNFRRLTNSLLFDPGDIAGQFAAAFSPVVTPVFSDEYLFNQFEVRAMDDPTAATAIQPTDDGGTNTNDAYQTDNAVYFQLKTGYRGRSFFGSKHFSGCVETHVDAGYLNATGQTAWTTIKTLMLAWTTTGLVDTAGNAWKLCIVSRVLSNLIASPATFTGADVISILLNTRVGTMGRRRGARLAV
jgi:hypothetical protein